MRVLFLVFMVASAQALVPSLADQLDVTQLHDAFYLDNNGTIHHGIRGEGQFFITAERPWDAHTELNGCHATEQIAELTANPALEGIPYSGASSGYDYKMSGIICGNGDLLGGKTLGIAPNATLLRIQDSYYQYGGHLELLASQATVATRAVHGNSGTGTQYIKEVGADPKALLVFQAHASGSHGEAEIVDALDSIQVAPLDFARKPFSVYPEAPITKPEVWPEISVPGCAITLRPPLLYPGVEYAFRGIEIVNGELNSPQASCPIPSVSEQVILQQNFLWQDYSVASATGAAAAVGLLAREVAPNVPVDSLREAMFMTADPFLPTIDKNLDGIITPHEFRNQHGNVAGWGMLDAPQFIAVANYMELHPTTSLETAIECAELVWIETQLWLNPNVCVPVTPVSQLVPAPAEPVPELAAEPEESKKTPAPIGVIFLLLAVFMRKQLA
jgi:hypothetical protein